MGDGVEFVRRDADSDGVSGADEYLRRDLAGVADRARDRSSCICGERGVPTRPVST